MLRITWICALLCVSGLLGQSPGLVSSIGTYLDEPSDSAAAAQLEALLATKPQAEAVLQALVAAPPRPTGRKVAGTFSFQGKRVGYRLYLPVGFAAETKRLPVLLDISGGQNLEHFKLQRCIGVGVDGLIATEFTDSRRDGYLKALRVATHRAHGDPDRLWVSGYSWAAHASWDIAFHRPGVLRGFTAFGGGPRRVHFRLLSNLPGMTLRSFCGAMDDPELVWNLREVERVAKRKKLDYLLQLDAKQGHNMPIQGVADVRGYIEAEPSAIERKAWSTTWPEEGRRTGVLWIDGVRVESPMMRIDAVVSKRVTVPRAIPVSVKLSADGKRRATIAAMEKKVARVSWKWRRKDGKVAIDLTPHYVKELTVFLRPPFVNPGDRVTLRVRNRVKFRGKVELDISTLLEEARRTGERVRPALLRITVRL